MRNKRNGSATAHKLWETALDWVSANMPLVRQVAAPYRRHMAADATDIRQEAVIAAFEALYETSRKKQPEKVAPFFQVIFRTSCIRLASGIPILDRPDIDNVPAPETTSPDEQMEIDLEHKLVRQALGNMTRRQRQVCCWLLQQPDPVSTPELAREFKISRRHACRLISGSIARLNGEVPA